VVDLAHGLVGLVHVSMKGRRIRRGLLELGQDGVAEGLGGDAGAVRDKKWCGYAWVPSGQNAARHCQERGRPTMAPIIPNFIPCSRRPTSTTAKHCSLWELLASQGRADRFLTLELSHVCTFQATALVVPFENLRMTDVEASAARTPASAR
jgi:hypothetical protein